MSGFTKSVLTETEEPETVVEEVTQESVVEVETTPKLVENEECFSDHIAMSIFVSK